MFRNVFFLFSGFFSSSSSSSFGLSVCGEWVECVCMLSMYLSVLISFKTKNVVVVVVIHNERKTTTTTTMIDNKE